MSKSIRKNPNMLDPQKLGSVMEDRWRRKQHHIWPSATAEQNDLQAAGIRVSHSTVCNWRSGLIPHHNTLMRIAASGWSSLVTYVQAPAMNSGEIATLEKEIEQREKANALARREIEARIAIIRQSNRRAFHHPDA